MDLDHRRHDVARHQRVAHAAVRLGDPVADVADGEDARLAASFENAVADLLDERPEVERAGMAHAIGAVDQHLRFPQVLHGPVHPKAQRVALEVHLAQALAAQLSVLCHPRTRVER